MARSDTVARYRKMIVSWVFEACLLSEKSYPTEIACVAENRAASTALLKSTRDWMG